MTTPSCTPHRVCLWTSVCLLLGCFVAFNLIAGCGGSAGSSGGSGSVATPKAAAPVVASVSPTTVPAGSSGFTLTVNGSNFQPQAVVNWKATPLVTTYVSASSLSAAVPASLAAAGSITDITVANPDGQVTTAAASSEITVTNPAPTLATASPPVLAAGSGDTLFLFTGTNFVPSTVVMTGTTALTTTFVSSTQLSAIAPAATLAPIGPLSFSVTNPAPGGGTSQSVSVTLRQPPAKLTALSPSSAIVNGSSAVNVTITGNYFTPTAAVYISNTIPAPTTYISPTSIRFELSALELYKTATLPITVRDPASQNQNSNALNFQVGNPGPVLNSISPSTITAGATSFNLLLTGSNFIADLVPSSTVQVNGVTVQASLHGSSTSMGIVIPASFLSNAGDLSITVTNPAPGGGTSNAQLLHVISAANRVRAVNLVATDLGWDSTHGLLVAASGSSTMPNKLVTIDPLQGTIVTTQPLSSSPAGISVTDDGSFVYVTLPSTGQIERFTLPSLTPDITFNLGNDSGGRYYMSNSVAAAPGHPHTVAITRHTSTTTAIGSDGGVVIYDDGVPRTNIALPGLGSFYDTLVWGADSTTLYGTNLGSSTADEDTFAVDANGVTLLSDRRNALGQFVRELAFDSQTSHLVDTYGNVVNAATGQSVAQMPVTGGAFALDTTLRRVFYLDVNGNIKAFDLDQFGAINSMLINGGGGSTMIRWGSSGLAIIGTQIYLVDGSFVSATGVSSAVGGYAAPSPTLTAVSPASVPAGSSDVQVALTGRDFTQASQVTWNNQTLAVNSISDTQILVTIPAAMLSSAVASTVAVSNGPGTASSQSIGFSVLPNLGVTAQLNVLNLSGQDLAWDSEHGLIYVAVPNLDPVYPNIIAVIDPTKAGIQQTFPIVPQASAISLSGDDQYLYVGSYAQAIVQRYNVPSFSLDLTIPSGAGVTGGNVGLNGTCTFAVDVKVAPDNPHTIAVSNGNGTIEPQGCGGLAIYDDATPRPGTLAYSSFDFTRPVWGADASTLFAQTDESFQPQSFHSLSVTSTGVTVSGAFGRTYLGYRLHYDTLTGLLFSDSGVMVNSVGLVQTGTLDNGGGALLVTDDALKRIFLLAKDTSGGSGQGAASYTLHIYDLTTQALLNSITFPGVLGYPTQMARWGSNGLVFVTRTNSTPGSSGVLYNVQGSAISGP